MSAYYMNRDTSIWGTDAHLLNPDRWLGEGSKRLNDQLFSSSKGARNCIGIKYVGISLPNANVLGLILIALRMPSRGLSWRVYTGNLMFIAMRRSLYARTDLIRW
jgi:hypothetical protein